MSDQTIIVMVLAATLGAFVFVAVQVKVCRGRPQHSLGDMSQPPPKDQTPPRADD